MRSLVDCYVNRKVKCAVEPVFEGPQRINISVSLWRDRKLKLAARQFDFCSVCK